MTGEKISIYQSEMWKALKWIQAKANAFQREKKVDYFRIIFKCTSGTFYKREENLKKKTRKYNRSN